MLRIIFLDLNRGLLSMEVSLRILILVLIQVILIKINKVNSKKEIIISKYKVVII